MKRVQSNISINPSKKSPSPLLATSHRSRNLFIRKRHLLAVSSLFSSPLFSLLAMVSAPQAWQVGARGEAKGCFLRWFQAGSFSRWYFFGLIRGPCSWWGMKSIPVVVTQSLDPGSLAVQPETLCGSSSRTGLETAPVHLSWLFPFPQHGCHRVPEDSYILCPGKCGQRRPSQRGHLHSAARAS